MPTTRKRRAHGIGLTDEIIAVLGLGCGINHMLDDELRALWKEHGQQVTTHWQRKYGAEPFVAMLSREEDW